MRSMLMFIDRLKYLASYDVDSHTKGIPLLSFLVKAPCDKYLMQYVERRLK